MCSILYGLKEEMAPKSSSGIHAMGRVTSSRGLANGVLHDIAIETEKVAREP